jgi:hypothetical protein
MRIISLVPLLLTSVLLLAQDTQPLVDTARNLQAEKNRRTASSSPLTEEGNCGIVYGEGHAFRVCAPKGWVLDNTILNEEGIYAVFYPKGRTWSEAKDNRTFMYINTARKGAEHPTAAALMKTDAEDTRQKAPAAAISEQQRIHTKNGDARVQTFQHGEFDRFEAVAYLDSPKIIVMIVTTSKDAQSFGRDYSAFEELVKSYEFLSTDEKTVDALRKTDNRATPIDVAREAVRVNMLTVEGHRYDGQIGMEFGRKYASIMQGCTKAGAKEDLGNFEMFVKVDKGGAVKEVLSSPPTKVATCVRRTLLTDHFTSPPKPMYWVNISMTIQP